MLAELERALVSAVRAASLDEGEKLLHKNEIEVALIDLDAADSNGLDTLEAALDLPALSSLPLVVLTEKSDAEQGIEAVRRGAQDFLDKNELSAPLLFRSLRYAIERNRLNQRVDVLNAEVDRNVEVQHLLRNVVGEKLAKTSEAFRERSLREFDDVLFNDLVSEYVEILHDSLHEGTHRVRDTVQKRLIELAHRMGFLRAGPKDLVDIHLAAFEQLKIDLPARREKLLQAEGRYVLLALMGHLLSYYRNYCMG